MKRLSTIMAAALVGLTAFPASDTAKQPNADMASIDNIISGIRTISVDGERDTLSSAERLELENRIRTFYYDQFRHSQDPDAPNFLFMSKKADLIMGIGGVLKARMFYDWGDGMPSLGFKPASIPIPRDKADNAALGSSLASTAIYFTMLGHSRVGDYRVYIEGGFSGYNNSDFKLKKAYGVIGDVTVGYAKSTFSDPAAEPPTADSEGATNKTSVTNVLVRYMPQLSKHVTAAVSVESAKASIDGADGICESASTRWPAAAAFLQYEWSKTDHVRLSALARGLSYRNLVGGYNSTLPGWGIQLSGVAHPAYPLALYGSIHYGRGDAGFTGSLSSGGYDLMPDLADPGAMYAPACMGYCVGAKYNFTPSVFSTVSFSRTRLYLHDESQMGDAFRSAWLGYANIFWNITSRIQVAAEMEIGHRENADFTHGLSRRLIAHLQVSF